MLLVPLGIEPYWVESGEEAGIRYGGGGSGPGALAHSRRAEGFFAGREALGLDEVTRRKLDAVEVPVFFADDAGEPDLVASTFYWLSGWHEHFGSRYDEHGRVTYAYSMNAAFGTSRLPVVDVYRSELASRLRSARLPVRYRHWKRRGWALCPTHDVDYLRKWRPGIFYREFVQYLLRNERREPVGRRLRRAARSVRQMLDGDPYVRALFEMPTEVSSRGGTATYFVKAGAGDPHDVPYRVGSALLVGWMKQLEAGGFEVGLHPSYRTIESPDRIGVEKARLENAGSTTVSSVRHHYLRFDLAASPRRLLEAGFSVDSTLGYAEHEGFRRGTCMPFQLYDLDEDRAVEVWEMPLAIMESALFNRRNLDLGEATEVTTELMEVCRRYRGVLVSLWHTTMADEIDCPGWRDHFVGTLEEAQLRGASISSLESALRSWA